MVDGAVVGKENAGASDLVVDVVDFSVCCPNLNPLPKVGLDCVSASTDLGPNKLGVPAAPNMPGFVPLVGACVPDCDCGWEDAPPVLAPNTEVGG